MKTISITEAQNNFSELISTVEQSEDIHLTRHGKPVAVLISEERYQQLVGEGKQVFNAIMQWRNQYHTTETNQGENTCSAHTEQKQNIVELLSIDTDENIVFEPSRLFSST